MAMPLRRDFYVYCWTNTTNGKRYVGRGTGRRAWTHVTSARMGAAYPLAYAIRKYGEASFTLEVVESGLSTDEANEREVHYIALWGTPRRGYNRTLGGGGLSGYRKSEESKRKVSLANLGRRRTPEAVERIRASLLKRDASVAEKIRQTLTGHVRTDASRKKQSESTKGRTFTPAHLAALSRAGMGRKASEAAKVAMRLGQTKLSPAQAENVRMLLALGARNRDVAEWFGVNRPMITRTGQRTSLLHAEASA